jgi:Mg-chelatase subunit ChlD
MGEGQAMNVAKLWLHVSCAGLLLMLGCRADALVSGPTTGEAAGAATATVDPGPTPPRATVATTTVAAAPPATVRVASSTAVATSPPEIRPTASPTPSPAAGSLQLTVDGQPISTDTLPSPEAYYADLLAKYGKDLSVCAAGPTPQPGSCPRPSSLGETELKQQINVELILDASGSMAESVGGEPKIATAKRVLTDFIGTLPKNANVALRVYGHKGSSSDADKAVSCAASELLYPFQPLDVGQFRAAIQGFQPSGWTPLGASLDNARRDFERFDPATSSNFVYVVTDGIETCDADPVAAARQLHDTNVRPIVNVVGFDVDATASQQLRQAAESGGGTYYEARNANDLADVFGSKVDWTAWTAYYNCLYDEANRQYYETTDEQNRAYYCALDLINGEYYAILDEANRRYDQLRTAADRADSGPDSKPRTSASIAQMDAFKQRILQNKDYAIQHEQQRWSSIINAQQSGWSEALTKAQADWSNALQDAARQQQQGPRP